MPHEERQRPVERTTSRSNPNIPPSNAAGPPSLRAAEPSRPGTTRTHVSYAASVQQPKIHPTGVNHRLPPAKTHGLPRLPAASETVSKMAGPKINSQVETQVPEVGNTNNNPDSFRQGDAITVPTHEACLDPNLDPNDECITKSKFGRVTSKRRPHIVLAKFKYHMICLPVYSHQGKGIYGKQFDVRYQYMGIRPIQMPADRYINDAVVEPLDYKGRFFSDGNSYVLLTNFRTVHYKEDIAFAGHIYRESYERLQRRTQMLLSDSILGDHERGLLAIRDVDINERNPNEHEQLSRKRSRRDLANDVFDKAERQTYYPESRQIARTKSVHLRSGYSRAGSTATSGTGYNYPSDNRNPSRLRNYHGYD